MEISTETRVVLYALATALLNAAGTFFQKLNGVRGGSNSFLTPLLLVATACYLPTFVLTNKAFLIGGKVSLFVPITALTYVFSMLAGRFYFGELVSGGRWLGCALIIAGVGAIARF
jgi:uncharacterized membrane protein